MTDDAPKIVIIGDSTHDWATGYMRRTDYRIGRTDVSFDGGRTWQSFPRRRGLARLAQILRNAKGRIG